MKIPGVKYSIMVLRAELMISKVLATCFLQGYVFTQVWKSSCKVGLKYLPKSNNFKRREEVDHFETVLKRY